jgi:hypothetical protein
MLNMIPFFKCGASKLSAIFNFAVDWIFSKFVPQVNNPRNWEDHFGLCVDCLLHNMDSLFDGLVGFVDGTLICVACPGANSVFANSALDQQSYYNGNHR